MLSLLNCFHMFVVCAVIICFALFRNFFYIIYKSGLNICTNAVLSSIIKITLLVIATVVGCISLPVLHIYKIIQVYLIQFLQQ